jgi:predicted ester cyclase
MSAEENKRLIRYFFEGVNAQDMTAFELFAPDAIHHNPFPGTPAGREGNKQGMLLLFAAFPDWQTAIEDLIAEGDKVVVRMTQRGTFFGIPPAGKQATVAGIAIFRLKERQIVEEWLITDQLGVLQQLGVIEGWKETP